MNFIEGVMERDTDFKVEVFRENPKLKSKVNHEPSH